MNHHLVTHCITFVLQNNIGHTNEQKIHAESRFLVLDTA